MRDGRLVQVDRGVGRARLEGRRRQQELLSQPVSSVVERLTPGPVSWNWTQPLQPVKSLGAIESMPGPPGRRA